VTQFDTLDAPDSYKFEISKIQDGGGRHLEKSKNLNTSASVRAILAKFGTVMQFHLLTVLTVEKLKF